MSRRVAVDIKNPKNYIKMESFPYQVNGQTKYFTNYSVYRDGKLKDNFSDRQNFIMFDKSGKKINPKWYQIRAEIIASAGIEKAWELSEVDAIAVTTTFEQAKNKFIEDAKKSGLKEPDADRTATEKINKLISQELSPREFCHECGSDFVVDYKVVHGEQQPIDDVEKNISSDMDKKVPDTEAKKTQEKTRDLSSYKLVGNENSKNKRTTQVRSEKLEKKIHAAVQKSQLQKEAAKLAGNEKLMEGLKKFMIENQKQFSK